MTTFEPAPLTSEAAPGAPVVSEGFAQRSGFIPELEDLQRLRRNYFRVRLELEQHKTVTRPAYYSWYQMKFGVQADRIQQMKLSFEDKSKLAKRMNDLYSWRGMTRQKAFAQATKDQEALKAKREREEQKANDEAARLEREARFQQSANERREPIEEVEIEKPTSIDLEIKSYYRKLVRALHPDRLGEESAALRAFWQETQDAYQARDLAKLKLIWTECLVEVDPEAGDFQIADLKVAISRLRVRFNKVQREKLELTQSDPTWRFDKKDRNALAATIAFDLNEEECVLCDELMALDREMSAFAREHSRG